MKNKTPRIALVGWQHETNTFSPQPTTLADFTAADSWPALVRGEAILSVLTGCNIPMSGAIAAGQAAGASLIPILWCSATPSGKVTAAAFDCILNEILAGITAQLPQLDGVYLDLHGAMVSETVADADGEILRRVRSLIGPDRWLVASLDLHANVSMAMSQAADYLLAYQTYPHVDMAFTGERALRYMLAGMAKQTKPVKYMKSYDFLLPMTTQCTLISPMAEIYADLSRCEQRFPVSISISPGFPLADTAETAPTLLVYADDRDDMQAAAEYMNERMQTLSSHCRLQAYTPLDAITYWQRAQPTARSFVFADTQDNPGCGGSGDTTGVLRELLAQQVDNAVVAVLYDPESAAAAHAAGVGARVAFQLGEKQVTDGVGPLTVTAEVMALHSGAVQAKGPFYQGCSIELGQAARIRVAGVDVVISSVNVQAADQALLRCVGAEPADYAVVVLKSSVHFRADFQDLAEQVLIVCAPGLNVADLAELPYQHVPLSRRPCSS